MTRTMVARNPLRPLACLSLAMPIFFGGYALAQADNTRPAVEINLKALKSTESGNAATVQPKRIVDGETVIILVPPSLQKKTPAPKPSRKIAAPAAKPAVPLPKTKVAKALPTPVPPINPAKLPQAGKEEKFAAVATPVAQMNTAPLPTPEQAEVVKEKVAQDAAEKVAEAVPEAKPAPVPQVKPEKPPEKEIQVAAIAPDPKPKVETAGAPQKLSRILFAEGETALPEVADDTLQAIAGQLASGERQNVQLLAYGTGNSVSAARRLSLGRALVVRSRLMELGVENRKIEVRALGKPEGDDPADRVDLVLIER